MFSKYELFSLDQTNFSFDLSQILKLRYRTPKAWLYLLPYLSNFALANWNPSSTQPSSCSSLVSLFCSTPCHLAQHLLDISNQMRRQSNQIYYQVIYKSRVLLYFNHLANSGCVKGLMRKGVVWGQTLFYLLSQSIDR